MMRYRVQYFVDEERRTAEIEAASPQEAVVKFRHTHADRESPCGREAQILSVSPEAACDEVVW